MTFQRQIILALVLIEATKRRHKINEKHKETTNAEFRSLISWRLWQQPPFRRQRMEYKRSDNRVFNAIWQFRWLKNPWIKIQCFFHRYFMRTNFAQWISLIPRVADTYQSRLLIAENKQRVCYSFFIILFVVRFNDWFVTFGDKQQCEWREVFMACAKFTKSIRNRWITFTFTVDQDKSSFTHSFRVVVWPGENSIFVFCIDFDSSFDSNWPRHATIYCVRAQNMIHFDWISPSHF